jgi:alanine-glyoxylate transaminase/serine-glyoxylate transaminase/serine-pyruvate transaminase
MTTRPGRHALQIPGPTNVPERVLRALSRPTIDHRGPEFAALAKELLAGLLQVFRTSGPVVVFPSSGTGAWEAALVNTLSPGDRVLMLDVMLAGALSAIEMGLALAGVPFRRGGVAAALERLGAASSC